MKNIYPKLFIVVTVLVLLGCSPKIKSSITTKQSSLPYDAEIVLFVLTDVIPDGLKNVGSVSLGDTGFTLKCNYETMIEKAKLEARKAGANVVKITEHKQPNAMGSSCHRIKAQLYFSDDIAALKNRISPKEPELLDVPYAMLHVYRHSGIGPLVRYDIKLGDTVLCRVRNNYKTTIKIEKEGLNRIWAKTESKVELPIDVIHGKQYYLRCSVKMGAFIGRPVIEFVDYKTGKAEFDSFDAKHTEQK